MLRKFLIFTGCLIFSTIICLKFTTQTVYAINESGDSNGGNLDTEGSLEPEEPSGGSGSGGSSGGGSSGGGNSGGGSGGGSNVETSKVAYDLMSLQCDDFGYTMLYYNSPITITYSGIAPTSAMKSHIESKVVSAGRQAYNIRKSLGGNNANTVCLAGGTNININITQHEDKNRAPHSWKYTWKYASTTGVKNPYFNQNNLYFDKDYTHFYTYSDEMIEEMIDDGYFDYLLPNNGGPTKEAKEEARKDINRSMLKEWYKERDYEPVVITGYDSWNVKRNIFLNPYYWHEAMMYFKRYYYDLGKGFLTVKGIEIDSEVKTYKYDPGHNANYQREYISNGYWWNDSKKRVCTDANNGTSNASDVNSCRWVPARYKEWWTLREYTGYVKSMGLVGVENVEQTDKTTDWQYYDRWVGYIEPTGKTDNDDPRPDNPKPPSENDFVCPLVFPKAVNAKNCRAYYRDGTIPRGSNKAEMDKGCPCSKLTNLTD